LYESRLAELFFGVLEFFVDLCEKVKFVQREVALRFWSGCLQMRNSLGCDCAWFGQLEQKVELGALSLKKHLLAGILRLLVKHLLVLV